MDTLDRKNAIDFFVKKYKGDIDVRGKGKQLNLSVAGRSQKIALTKVMLPEIGGDEKTGLIFDVIGFSNSFSDLFARVRYDSDLDILLKTQVDNFPGILPESPVYDLRSLITHDEGHYGVNFVWAASMFPIAVPNLFGYTAGQRLFDMIEILIGAEHVDMVIGVGERANAYAGVIFDRLRLPFTCSRPEGGKIKKEVVTYNSVSSYKLEAGMTSDATPEVKPHYIDSFFMNKMRGKKIGILDDLDATRNTLYSFGNAVREYGGEPVGFTVDHLAYLPEHILVQLDFPVYSVFSEKEVGRPLFAKEMKEALRSTYWKLNHDRLSRI